MGHHIWSGLQSKSRLPVTIRRICMLESPFATRGRWGFGRWGLRRCRRTARRNNTWSCPRAKAKHLNQCLPSSRLYFISGVHSRAIDQASAPQRLPGAKDAGGMGYGCVPPRCAVVERIRRNRCTATGGMSGAAMHRKPSMLFTRCATLYTT